MPNPRETPDIDDSFEALGYPPSVSRRLGGQNLYKLADLTRISADRLLAFPGIGALTVDRLRRQLQSIGLDFSEPADPVARARERHRRAHSEPASARGGLTNASQVADLQVPWRVVRSCILRDVTTIGQLRRLSRKQIADMLTARSAADLAVALAEAGLPLGDASKRGVSATAANRRPRHGHLA